MKNKVIRLLLISGFLPLHFLILAQNVGIGTLTPSSKLHITGSADTTQLIIDAYSTQSNTHPLIKLRNSSGVDLMWITSDQSANIFIGVNAGRVNTGPANIFIGQNAGYSNTFGVENVANGYHALYANTMGSQNTALGDWALYSNVAGSNATAIGYKAMFYANDSGTPFTNYNVALGNEALKGNSLPSLNTGNYNTALGSLTLWSNTTGSANNASGFEVLYNNTTGESNTANGANALFNNTTGSENTANGFGVLQSNVAGNGATAMGTRAMQNAYNGSTPFTNYNVAVGFEALKGNSLPSLNTGNYNTALGSLALWSNTTGSYNTANGLSALYSNSIGIHNTANGYQSLWSNTTGYYNTANGVNALYYNNGNSNTANGEIALYFNETGSNNTAVGRGAFYINETGSDNTALGFYAGADNISGSKNTFIGSGANLASSTQRTNATAIGYNAKVNASNTLVLGGTGANAVNVGIGTETPSYPLEVTSAAGRTGNFINTAPSADYYGVYGTCTNTPNYGYGVYGSSGWIGVKGEAIGAGIGSRYGVWGYATGGDDNNWAVYSSGSSYATGTWQSSDEMFKKDIHPIENAVEKLKQLDPSTYNFKTEEYNYMGLPSEPQFGFLAQDIEKVFPELVRNIEQPIDHNSKEKGVIQFKGINYIELIPVTIAVFQEQQKTIEELKDQVEQLLLRIETLEKK